jgi:hypothetical protein
MSPKVSKLFCKSENPFGRTADGRKNLAEDSIVTVLGKVSDEEVVREDDEEREGPALFSN